MHPCQLKEAEKQEITAKKFGFYWKNFSQIIEQIQSECLEVQEAYDKNNLPHLQEEIGDLLQAVICAAVYCNFDPQETLQKSIAKFQKRYEAVVNLAKNDGLENLQNQPEQLLSDYWKQAKQV